MKLSRTVSYAVRAAIQLAQCQTSAPVPCSQLAATGNMPERFLLQVLRSLVTHGILRSTRGVEGGYSLVRDPIEISLLEVIEAIEGPLNSDDKPLTEGLSQTSQSKLQEAFRQVTATSRKQLEDIKLAHLIDVPQETAE